MKRSLWFGIVVSAAAAGCSATVPGGGTNGSGGAAAPIDAADASSSGATGGAPATEAGAPESAGAMDVGTGREASAEASADVMADAPAASDADQSPCTANSLRPGNSNLVIPFGGNSRDYVLHVPPSYTGKTRVAVVVDMHGAVNVPQQEIGGSGWLQKSDQAGFITIFPHGQGGSWNAGTCCAPAGAPSLQTSTADDVGFIRAVIAKTAQDGCIDLKRVYAVGLSNGGLMSYRLACDAADLIAGIAPVSGASVAMPCKPSRPVNVVAFRGTMDATVPYNGGMPGVHLWPSAMADHEQWRMLNQCTSTPTTSRGVCQTYSQCAGGVEVTMCSVVGGHVLYGPAAAANIAVPNLAWEIFQRHAGP